MKKLKVLGLTLIILFVLAVVYKTISYYKYHEGYIYSDIITCDCIEYSIEQILLSQNSQEKKKELISNLCSYSYAEITIENISNKTMFYEQKISDTVHNDKKYYKPTYIFEQTIKIQDEYYSIKYTTYIPKWFTTMVYSIFLNKIMMKIGL